MKARILPIAALALAPLLTSIPVRAADNAQIGGLVDLNFGTIASTADEVRSANVSICSYRGNPNRLNYTVNARGSGPSGSFALSSGAQSLPYDVQWADTPNQTGGSLLQSGVASGGFGNALTGFTCPQQAATASLTVTIRAASLGMALAGTYGGSLQITITPQ